jgi:hypothetical protein
MSNYVAMKYASYPGACVLQNLTGLEATFRLNNGTPLEAEFPKGVAFHMNPDFPNDLALGDSLLNSDMLVIGSARLRAFLSARKISQLEYLPVGIVDTKGRLSSEEYFVIHPIEPVDCLDRAQSVFKASILNPAKISEVSKLVLSEAAIPPDREIFRIAGFWNLTLVRRDLAEAITSQGFSGIRWIETSAHPET